MTADFTLYFISMLLQLAAVAFSLRMAVHHAQRAPWIVMSAALFFMLTFRVLGALTSGNHPFVLLPDPTFRFMSAAASVAISALLFLSLFSIRRLTLRQQEATAAQRVSENRLASIINNAPSHIFMKDYEGRYTLINTPFGALVGRPVEEIAGKGDAELFGADVAARFHADDQRVITRREPMTYEESFEFEARAYNFLTTKFPLFDAHGQIIGVGGIATDVSALKSAERRHQVLFENTQDAILMADDSGRYVDANPAACSLTGYDRDGLLTKSVWDLTPPPNRATGERLWREFIAGGKQGGEYMLIRKDGSTVAAEYRAVANILPGLHLSVLRDITQRKQFEEALRLGEERLRLGLDAGDIGTWDWDVVNNHVTWSSRVYEFHGVKPGDFRGTVEDFAKLVHPDDLEHVQAAIRESLEKGAPYRVEFKVRHADGTIHWLTTTGRVYFDASGKPVRMLGATMDVTERKRAEQQRDALLASEQAARAEAEQVSRTKDEFLATLSHELRTPLNAILGWSQLLAGGDLTDTDLATGLDVIQRNTRVQVQLIEDLLDMSRITSGKLRLEVEQVSPGSVVDAASQSVSHSALAKGVLMEKVIDPAAGPILGDPDRLQQVIWNLLSNAIKFTPKGGKVEIVTSRVSSQVEIRVADSGQGIAPQFLPHVFERFRQADGSTTRKYGGLGLGLAIVKHLVEMHGGSVRAESPGEGQGATFVILLPLSVLSESPDEGGAEAVRKTGMSRGFVHPRLNGVRVLVVDDEPDARELIKRLLHDCDAEVTTAGSVDEAMELQRVAQPHVLIGDIGMPKADGYELVRRFRSLPSDQGAQIPALALTAFARSEDRMRALLAGYQMHLPKPVEPAELLVAVASLAGRTDSVQSTGESPSPAPRPPLP